MTQDDVTIRPYTADDALATLGVFERAVTETARSRYSAAQVGAWLGGPRDLAAWHARRASAATVVAVVDGEVAGFTDLRDEGYVDMLFVSPDHGRRGIGARLLTHVVESARRDGLSSLSTHASEVARPVFERAGFAVVERETVHRGDVTLDRYLMRRSTGPVDVVEQRGNA